MSESRRPKAAAGRRLVVAALVVAFVAGVVAVLRPAGAVRPAPITLGVDTCAECGMVIRDPRAAAQLIRDGQVLKFDDVGCLLVYRNRQQAPPGEPAGDAAPPSGTPRAEVVYVTDWYTGEWLEAPQAWWVPTAHKTPMLYGLVTVKDRARAEALAAEHGSQVLTFEQASRLERFLPDEAGSSPMPHAPVQGGHHP